LTTEKSTNDTQDNIHTTKLQYANDGIKKTHTQ